MRCRNVRTPDLTLQASFHSDLFNYIFKYPVIQIIWRIKIISEKIKYLPYAIHMFTFFFYYTKLILVLANTHTHTHTHTHTVRLLFVHVTWVHLWNLRSLLRPPERLSQACGCYIFINHQMAVFDTLEALNLLSETVRGKRASQGFICQSLIIIAWIKLQETELAPSCTLNWNGYGQSPFARWSHLAWTTGHS